MNLSKETTMIILSALIETYNDINDLLSENECLELEAEIKCFQFHLRSFEK